MTYIKYFEKITIIITSLSSPIYLKYVDDNIIHSPYQEDGKVLLDHVNSINPHYSLLCKKNHTRN